MTQAPKVSIIVPVYKAEKYLRRCVDSILAQTFTDFELLLIDDGSPDSSGEICDQYAASDQRVRVFHKPNGGVSSARNVGLDKAIGEWLMFVDADDEICCKTLEICIEKVNRYNLDLLQFSYVRTNNYKYDINADERVLDSSSYIMERNYLVSVWGSLIRASIIKVNSIYFDTNLKLAEDQLVMMDCIRYADRLMRSSDELYYYRSIPCSATKRTKSEDSLRSIQAIVNYKYYHPEFRAHIDNMILYFIGDIIKNHDTSIWHLADIITHSDIVFTDKSTRNVALIGKCAKFGKIMAFIAMLIYSIRNS